MAIPAPFSALPTTTLRQLVTGSVATRDTRSRQAAIRRFGETLLQVSSAGPGDRSAQRPTIVSTTRRAVAELGVDEKSVIAGRIDVQRVCGGEHRVDRLLDSLQHRIAERAGGQSSDGPLVAFPLCGGMPGEAGCKQPVLHPPVLQAVERGGQIVGRLAVLAEEVELQSLPEEGFDRVIEELLQLGEADHRSDVRSRRQDAFQERSVLGSSPAPGNRAVEGRTVEAPWPGHVQLAGEKAAVVERLTRVDRLDPAPVLGLVERRERRPDRVAQLGEHGRGRHLEICADVVACPGDHEVVGGREKGFEERLADLRARVVVTDERRDGREIVTVDAARAARADLVETEQADHAEGQPAQRRQRTHGDPAAEELRARRRALQPIGEQAPDVAE